jgi:hypothetical protein
MKYHSIADILRNCIIFKDNLLNVVSIFFEPGKNKKREQDIVIVIFISTFAIREPITYR